MTSVWRDRFARVTGPTWGVNPDFPPDGSTFIYQPPGNGSTPNGRWISSGNTTAGDTDSNSDPLNYVNGAEAVTSIGNAPSSSSGQGIGFAAPFGLPLDVVVTDITLRMGGARTQTLSWQCYLAHAFGVNYVGFYPWVAFAFSSDNLGNSYVYITASNWDLNGTGALRSLLPDSGNSVTFPSGDFIGSLFNARIRLDEQGAHFRLWHNGVIEPSTWMAETMWAPGYSLYSAQHMVYPLRAFSIENDVFDFINGSFVAGGEMTIGQIDIIDSGTATGAGGPFTPPALVDPYGLVLTGWGRS